MKISKFINKCFLYLLFGSLLVVFQRCDKYHAKKTAGIYTCEVNYYYWDMTPITIDSTYSEKLEVVRDGKYITVLNYRIHIDSLWKGKEYYDGYVHDYIKIKFINDSLYMTRSGGGLGGNASWTYRGKK